MTLIMQSTLQHLCSKFIQIITVNLLSATVKQFFSKEQMMMVIMMMMTVTICLINWKVLRHNSTKHYIQSKLHTFSLKNNFNQLQTAANY